MSTSDNEEDVIDKVDEKALLDLSSESMQTITKHLEHLTTDEEKEMEENCRRSTRTKEHKNYLEMASGTAPLVERSTNTKYKKPKRKPNPE